MVRLKHTSIFVVSLFIIFFSASFVFASFGDGACTFDEKDHCGSYLSSSFGHGGVEVCGDCYVCGDDDSICPEDFGADCSNCPDPDCQVFLHGYVFNASSCDASGNNCEGVEDGEPVFVEFIWYEDDTVAASTTTETNHPDRGYYEMYIPRGDNMELRAGGNRYEESSAVISMTSLELNITLDPIGTSCVPSPSNNNPQAGDACFIISGGEYVSSATACCDRGDCTNNCPTGSCGNGIVEGTERCDGTNFSGLSLDSSCDYECIECNVQFTCPSDNNAPQANFTMSDNNPILDDTVTFINTSVDSDGWIETTEWYLDGSNTVYSTANQITLTFDENREYTVRLRVVDNNGTSDAKEASIPINVIEGPVCGNQIIEGAEVCDDPQFNGVTCESEGFLSSYNGEEGYMTCIDSCSIASTENCLTTCDTETVQGNCCSNSDCEGDDTCVNNICTDADDCGNGYLDAGEYCDGNEFRGNPSCSTSYFDETTNLPLYIGGPLLCSDSCTVLQSGCVAICADNEPCVDTVYFCEGVSYRDGTFAIEEDEFGNALITITCPSGQINLNPFSVTNPVANKRFSYSTHKTITGNIKLSDGMSTDGEAGILIAR